MITQKRFRWSNIALFSIVAVFLIGMAFAATYSVGIYGATNFSLNEDTYYAFNITINMSAGLVNETVSYINITFPIGFSLNLTTNLSSLGTAVNLTYDSVNNVLSWYNATANSYLLNTSAGKNNTAFAINGTVAIPGIYNVTLKIYTWDNNGTALITSSRLSSTYNLSVYVNDTSYPTGIVPISAIDSIISKGNYSGTKIFNITIIEDLPSLVLLNITNSTVVQVAGLNASRQGTSYYFNGTLVTTGFTDGVYQVRVQINDTKMAASDVSLSNDSYAFNFTIDNTKPVITLSKTSSTASQIVVGIAITDATAGIGNTCTSLDGNSATITGTGTSQVLTRSDFACGGTYTFTVTCSDSAGNSKTAIASYSTDDCGAGAPTSTGGPTAVTWTNTIVPTTEQLTAGVENTIAAKERVKVTVGNIAHYVGVTSLTATQATIQISSNPVNVNLAIGQDAKVDVNDDGTYDVYVKLNSIASNKANVLIQKISETIPTGAGAVSTTGEQITTGGTPTPPPAKTPTNLTWVWVVIAIIIVVAIIAGISIKKKK